jgi:phosphoribosylcarboxyaminoimidazole (NCAIR) mutase
MNKSSHNNGKRICIPVMKEAVEVLKEFGIEIRVDIV